METYLGICREFKNEHGDTGKMQDLSIRKWDDCGDIANQNQKTINKQRELQKLIGGCVHKIAI